VVEKAIKFVGGKKTLDGIVNKSLFTLWVLQPMFCAMFNAKRKGVSMKVKSSMVVVKFME
jgi:hypothetical protein